MKRISVFFYYIETRKKNKHTYISTCFAKAQPHQDLVNFFFVLLLILLHLVLIFLCKFRCIYCDQNSVKLYFCSSYVPSFHKFCFSFYSFAGFSLLSFVFSIPFLRWFCRLFFSVNLLLHGFTQKCFRCGNLEMKYL